MANNNTAIIIIGMVLIVALTMYGPFTSGLGNFLDDAWDKWGDIFGDIAPQGDLGSMGIGVTIEFADGTTEEYKPSGSALFPLKILIDNKEIESITWTVWLKVDWTGTLDSLVATGDLEVYTMTETYFIGSTTISYSGVPTKNDWQLIESLTLTDTEIENNLPDGLFFVLEGYAMSTMTFTFADGIVVTKTPEMGPAQVHVTWQTGALTVFQINLGSTYI